MIDLTEVCNSYNTSLSSATLNAPKIKHSTSSDNNFSFSWEGAFESKALKLLRETIKLDSVVGDCKKDLDKIKLTTLYIHNLCEHDGWSDLQTRDPVAIAKKALNGETFRCVEFSILMAGCLRAINIPARILSLKTKEVETTEVGAGHVTVEAFVDNQWVFIDPQACFIPSIDGKLLSAVDLCYHLNTPSSHLVVNELKTETKTDDYVTWIKDYLYYFDTFLSPVKEETKVMLVPLGAKHPTVFQKYSPLTDILYTSSLTAFYAKHE